MDCGANVGTFAKLAFDAGAAKVIAVEPSPLNVEALRRNFPAEIADGRFILIDKAVWNEPGEMELNIYELSVLDSLVMEERHEAPAKSKVKVELTTIDAIVEELALDRLDFIKMDIEGAERQALEGAAGTLRRFQPRMSIATENLLDDVDVLPATILAIAPDYDVRNGRCLNLSAGVLRPEAVSFEPSR
jgi:FkbM family methyltransferase